MNNFFEGLEALGFENLDKLTIYEEKQETQDIPAVEKKETTEEDCLYEKSYTCPVCSLNFKAKTVKSGKARLVSTDTDFKPNYSVINPMKYDVILCPYCGYAALTQYFNSLRATQIEWIKNQISSVFKTKLYPNVYTIEIAIERYKLALLNAIVKKARMSEKAYICLKIAWLYRELEDKDNEHRFLEQALKGFLESFEKERFPVCGMNEHTLTYLIGDLYRRTGDTDNALKWLSDVLLSRNVNARLKDKARDVKDVIKEDRQKNQNKDQ
ncbi:MAG: DUF2225 domain-containing protein [Epulopiscium sp.]|nr:DUF2225 domain-containing protein [Candidatus Epulonipiscium sp.]